MFVVSYLMFKLVQMQETGNITVWNAVGEPGTVYMNIPGDGVGKVRVSLSGTISFVNARSQGGLPLSAGTKVMVVGIVNDNTLEVAAAENLKGE